MARKRTSAFEDLAEIGSRLPWWLAVTLAVITYFALHAYAVRDIPVPQGTHGIGDMVSAQLWKTVAIFGQYVVPAALALGAVLSVARRRKRTSIYRSVAGQPGKDALNGISWREFEMLVGEWFRHQGYAVTETGGVADGGVDLVLSRDGETSLVQCKQWKAFKVGVSVIRELLGVMAARGAAAGFVVTSGVFTEEAKRFAADVKITLIDGQKLSGLLRRVPQKQDLPTAFHEKPLTDPMLERLRGSQTACPACPVCGSTMTLRKVSKGDRAGQSFWGCPTFPSCRGTRPF